MERANNCGRVDVWDVALHLAESLNVLPQGLSLLLDEQMQITLLAMRLVAAREGTDKLMTQVRPRRDGAVRQVHEPRPDIRLEHQREVVGEDLLVAPSGSLHRDGVDAEELRRVRLAVVLLGYIWLERAVGGPLELPQLTGKDWATYLVG